jgi:hypothetical protein
MADQALTGEVLETDLEISLRKIENLSLILDLQKRQRHK